MPPKYSPHYSDSRSDSLERSRSKKSKKSKKNKKEKKKKKSKKREKSAERAKSPGTPVVDDHKEENNGHDQAVQEEQGGTPTIDEKPTTPTKIPPKLNTPPSAQRAPPKPEEKNGEEPKYTIDKTVYPYKPDFEP